MPRLRGYIGFALLEDIRNMMEYPFDLAVFIGRFQPFHNGHLNVIRNALEHAERVLIIVGSSNVARSSRNPFTYPERSLIIAEALNAAGLRDRVFIRPARDFPYDLQAWLGEIQNVVREAGGILDNRICLTGHIRDMSSFYLRKFPQWSYLPAEGDTSIHGTAIRKPWLENATVFGRSDIPEPVSRFLTGFRTAEAFEQLRAEYNVEIDYRLKWGNGPFQTADAVVVQSGHLLVVERGDYPGKGMLALPGGHLNVDETLDQCAVRELFEETELFAGEKEEIRKNKVWAGYRGRERFDDPYRSLRSRVITEAFLFKLPDDYSLPRVRGGDDAARAFWMPLSQAKPERMFEDHGFIVDRMLRYL